ncbi:MAG: DUF748 domain-containing protein [Burkholderiales bacterium]|nr:DUF748 domain-containing protein [Burkholderiales bacterium]
MLASASPDSSPRRPWWRWPLRIFLALGAIMFALFCSLAWLLPHALTQTAPNWLKEKSGRELKMATASFNPFTLHLKASDVALRDGKNTLAKVSALDVKGSWASLKDMALMTDHITITRPEINARIKADGSMDWVQFLDAFPKSNDPPSDKIPRVVLRNVSIESAAFRLSDERAGAAEQRLALEPISFKLDKLSTLPRDRGDYSLQATLNDKTRVQWKGRVGLNPVESSGDVVLTDLPLSRIPAMANIKLPVGLDGTAAIRANYSVAAGTDFTAAGVGDGSIEIAELRVLSGSDGKGDSATAKTIKLSPISASWAKTKTNGKESQVFAFLPVNASLQGINVKAAAQPDSFLNIAQIATAKPFTLDLATQRIDVPNITITGLQANALRDKNGTMVLPFASMPASSPAAPAQAVATTTTPATTTAAPQVTPATGWQIGVGEIISDKAALTLSDQSFATPQITTAKLDLTLGARIATGDKSSVIISSKRAALTDVVMRDSAAPDAWFSAKEFRVAPFEINAQGTKIELPKMDIVAPLVSLALDQAGVDVAKKFAPAVASAPAAAPAKPSANAPPFSVSIAGVSLSNGRVNFVDNTLPTALTHVVDAIGINVERIEVNGTRPINATFKGSIGSGGAAQAKVKFDQRASSVDTEFSLERVALAAFSPYLNRNTRLKLTKGEAALDGRVQAALGASETKADAIRFDGKMAVREFELIDETTNAPFTQWAELSSQNIRITSGNAGLNVTLADLLLDQPRGRFIIAEDGTLNLSQVGKASAVPPAQIPTQAPTQTPASTVTQPAPMPTDSDTAPVVKVRRVQVTGGDVEFADLSLRPQFGTRISDLSGLIVGLSTELSSRAEVSLEGKVDQFGLARISGAIAPMGATEFTDIKAIFRNLEMKNLTPYSGKFAGRKIESGKLSLDLEYKIQQRKLKGENQIVIDNLVLGERVDSKEASNLPLDLAIALLRDSNGVIELGLPVQGSLDDPQFSYGSLIWKAIGNVLTKIATAPFRALGALLGGSGEEFEAVNFEPGEARLLPPEREKLGKLVKALEKRPQLKLTVEGRFDKARDREALADNILKLEVSKRAGMKPPGANEPLVISFTDTKVQAALDELAASAGDEAVRLRAQYLPPAGNAVTGMLQNARERLSPTARAERAAARAKYYPELFKLLQVKQAVPDIAYATLAGFRAEVIRNTLTAVNTISADRVSVAAPQPAKASKLDQVATTLALSVK